ncbi:Os04g0687125 [Oryza sativa Japonica Group]|uniref:Os04g0687125 protein n=1 Tax=Oryza sativa subsp. japonica TaxID=39947 RepID=A0A0P0WGY1_ORYSJ|nr:hypothetical protein EE612_026393 [Oryza sativa]BAS91746.1 Os04g0687125 [Oryza sativa Japonica Group]
MTVFRIISTYCYYLVILLTLVNHGHKANCSSTEEGTRNNRLLYLHQDQNIHWIIVFTKCPWNETIIMGIHN